MPRRIPFSPKKKRDQILGKRAQKRGDTELAPDPHDPGRARKGTKKSVRTAGSSRRLQSSFVKLPTPFLEHTRVLASTLPLGRPISTDAAVLQEHWDPLEGAPPLTCPKRPRWRYDMSKKELDANEQSLFGRWLTQTDDIVDRWCNPVAPASDAPDPSAPAPEAKMPHAPTSFERNLEVWRQLCVPLPFFQRME
ncbi:hypothetical protein IEO21_09948 [Rhodonia placenta]|uniref:Uncharacterized protein n=1 Tax=Rhodonia placenta TaxID=104341 RepID=A0A8H7NTI5_9APHY|nr:hypothetical protein IEO21_09948 [Postia placenta]